jgi:hypothetical protein
MICTLPLIEYADSVRTVSEQMKRYEDAMCNLSVK